MSDDRLLVAHVIGGGDTGGAMTHLLPLLDGLRRQGAEVHLLCLGGGGLADAATARGLPTTVLPMDHPWDVRMLPALRGELEGPPWDVVHSHGMRANLPVRLILRRRGVGSSGRPCLFTTVHSDLSLDYGATQARVYRALDRATRDRVDRVVCVSRDLARRAVDTGVDPARVLVIPSGLELEDGPGLPDPSPTRAEPAPPAPAGGAALGGGADVDLWGGAPPEVGAPRIGTVARFVPVKDLGLLVDVVAELRPAFPELRALIVGDGPERSRVADAVRAAGLTSAVSLPGEIRPAAPTFAELDVFVLTSQSEGVPLAVLEAMAAGLPVVAFGVGGLPDVVVDGVTGFLVPRTGCRPDDARRLADRLTLLLRDATLRTAMGAAGVRRVCRRFTADAAAAATLAAYRECLAAREV